jgi:hypothetical protein
MVTSFSSGNIARISAENCRCNLLQPMIAPSMIPGNYDASGQFTPSTPDEESLWRLCFQNRESDGKSLIMDVNDRATGKSIATAIIPIVP